MVLQGARAVEALRGRELLVKELKEELAASEEKLAESMHHLQQDPGRSQAQVRDLPGPHSTFL